MSVSQPPVCSPPSGPHVPDRTLAILVLDDDPVQLDLLRLAFRSQAPEIRLQVFCVREGASAILASGSDPEIGRDFDVILVDQWMGSVDAAAVIPWLKRSHPDTPILIISHSPMTTEQIRASGAHGFVAKPRSAQDVRALTAACLSLALAKDSQRMRSASRS